MTFPGRLAGALSQSKPNILTWMETSHTSSPFSLSVSHTALPITFGPAFRDACHRTRRRFAALPQASKLKPVIRSLKAHCEPIIVCILFIQCWGEDGINFDIQKLQLT